MTKVNAPIFADGFIRLNIYCDVPRDTLNVFNFGQSFKSIPDSDYSSRTISLI